MLRSGSVVKGSLRHLVVKRGEHPNVSWSQLRGNSYQHRETLAQSAVSNPENPLSQDKGAVEQNEIYHQVEHLSLANLKNFILATGGETKDLERTFDQYLHARQVTTPFSFSADNVTKGYHSSSLPTKDTKYRLTGQCLDKLFAVDSEDCFMDTPLCSSHSSKESNINILNWNSACVSNLSQGTLSRSVLFSATSGSGSASEEPNDKPNIDVLNSIEDHLATYVPRMLQETIDHTKYSEDVALQNNYNPDKPVIVKGRQNYVVYVAKMRAYAHLVYARSRIHVVDSWVDTRKGTVSVHWRFSGLTQLQSMMFWKFNFVNMSKSFENMSRHVELISTFQVNKEGLIYNHTIDRMRVDAEPAKKSVNPLLKLLRRTAPASI